MFDSHVHAAPGVHDRIGDDLDVAGAYDLAGFDGANHRSIVDHLSSI